MYGGTQCTYMHRGSLYWDTRCTYEDMMYTQCGQMAALRRTESEQIKGCFCVQERIKITNVRNNRSSVKHTCSLVGVAGRIRESMGNTRALLHD